MAKTVTPAGQRPSEPRATPLLGRVWHAVGQARVAGVAVVFVAVLLASVFAFGFAGADTSLDDGEALVASNPADPDAEGASHVVTVQIGADDEIEGETLEGGDVIIDYGEDVSLSGGYTGEYISPNGDEIEQLGTGELAEENFFTIPVGTDVDLDEGATIRTVLSNAVDNGELADEEITVIISTDDGPSTEYTAEVSLGEDAGITVDAAGVDGEYFSSLQQAVEAVGDTSDATVSVEEGTFNELNAQPTVLSNNDDELEPIEVVGGAEDLTIEGAGSDETTIVSEAISESIIDGNNADGLGIEGITFDGDGRVQQADTGFEDVDTVGSDVTISGVETGIAVSGSGATIDDVTFHSIESTAIDVSATGETTIDAITLEDSEAEEGVWIRNEAAEVSVDENGGASTIEGVDRAIYAEFATAVEIGETQIDDIDEGVVTDAAETVSLSGTQITGVESIGVDVVGGIETTIDGVTIEGEDTADGIQAVGGTNPVTVTQSTIEGVDRGVDLSSSDSIVVADVQFDDVQTEVVRTDASNVNGVPTSTVDDVDIQNSEDADALVLLGPGEVSNLNVGDSTAEDTMLSFEGQNVIVGAAQDPPEAPADQFAIDRYFEAADVDPDTGNGELTDLELSYEDEDVPDGVDPETISLWKYDDGDEAWEEVDGSGVDTDENVVVGEITDFSPFGAFAEGESQFDVEITDIEEPVIENEELVVDATVENTGQLSDTQDVSLSIAPEGEDGEGWPVEIATEEDVELDPDESTDVTFDIDLAELEGDVLRGEWDVEVATDDDEDLETITVRADFQVEILETNSPVTEGETAEVTAEITDATSEDIVEGGPEEEEQTITLGIDDEEEDSTTVTLGPDDTTEEVTLEWETEAGDEGEYDAEVASVADDDTAPLVVEPPAAESELSNLDIAGGGEFTFITQGADEEISVDVENVGTAAGSFDVELSINDGPDPVAEAEETTGELAPGESQTVTFDGVTDELDVSEGYGVVVSTEDDEITGNLAVDPPGVELSELDIAGQGDDATITQGDDEDISVDVRLNFGEGAQEITVTLGIEDEIEETEQIELGVGESETVVFEEVTGEIEPDEYDVEVEAESEFSGDFSIDGDLTVEPAPEPELSNLDVAGQGADATITEGDDGGVAVDVTNVGGEASSFDVTLDIGGEVETAQTTDVLVPDGTQTVTFDGVTGGLDPGEYAVEVAAEPTEAPGPAVSTTGTLTVEAVVVQPDPAESALSNLDIAGQGADASITEGDDGDVSVDVTNVGEEADSFAVTLDVGGEVEASAATGELEGDEMETVTFAGVTGGLDPGEYTVTVSTDDDQVAGALGVAEDEEEEEDDDDTDPPEPDPEGELAVEIVAVDSPVEEGTVVDVTAEVENVGDALETADVVLTVGDATVDSTEVELPGGSSTIVTLAWETGEGDAGDHTVEVSTPDDSDTATVTVTEPEAPPEPEPPEFQVAIDEVSVHTDDENRMVATATITNSGEETDTQTVTLTVNEVERDSQELTLDAGESQTVTFEWERTEDDVGELTVEVASENDIDTSVTLDEDDEGVDASTWGLLLLLLLAAALAVYYYVRRRR